MKLRYLLVAFAVLWTSHGKGLPHGKNHLASNSQHKIVRKQNVPSHIRKQYIDTYGGNSVMGSNTVMGNQDFGETESQNFIENGQQAQDNIESTLQGAGISLNSGLTQNGMGGSQVESMSNDLVTSTEATDGRQMIGNDLMQGGGGGLDVSPDGNAAGGIGGSLGDSLSAGLGGGGIEGGGLEAGLGGGTSLGLGGGTVDVGGGAQAVGALNDGLGATGDIGVGNGDSVGANIGGAGLGEGGVETIGGASLAGNRISAGGLGDSAVNLGDSAVNLGDSGITGGLDGNVGGPGLNSLGGLGGGLGDNLGGGVLGGGDNQIGDSLAGLGENTGGLGDGIGLDALGSRIAAGSKAHNLGPLAGAHHMAAMAGLGSNGGILGGMQGDHQTPIDMQLSDAPDENPSMIHTGLGSILPGKTVHAHVSDKPTENRPAISGPSMNAALQVQEQARKQHKERLEALKLKLKKLRGKLEALQKTGDKQDTITSSKENVNKEEINTLNELRMATQDAIKELHDDYPRAKKKQETAKSKQESLDSKLKTVDFTAKETGDTLEELLKLLDPELQDKKRGQVDKMNNTQLDEDATNKLASLTKKAEDEVEKLAAQSPKPKTDPPAKTTSSGNTAKDENTPSKALPKVSNKSKLKKILLKTGKTKSTKKPKKLLKYKSLGCWQDDPNRIVPSLENTSTLLKDGYRVRQDSVKKCAQVAKKQGFSAFAVENGGQCFGGENLLKTYKKYGRSRDCANDGRGGDYAMEVMKNSIAALTALATSANVGSTSLNIV